MSKNIQVKNDEGMGHDMLRPKMPRWISNMARNPFWVSQASIKLSLSRAVLWAEINLSTVVAYSILYQWAFNFPPPPYFVVELLDPEQWQSHVCRRIYVHRIHMCFRWNVRCQDIPTVEHCGCKQQFSFVKCNFTPLQQDSVQLRHMRWIRLHPACLVTKKERFLIVRLNQGPLFFELNYFFFYIWGLIISPDPQPIHKTGVVH